MFFDHDVYYENNCALDYLFIKINSFDTVDSISKIINSKLQSKNITFYCDNTYIHKNNRNGEDNLQEIKKDVEEKIKDVKVVIEVVKERAKRVVEETKDVADAAKKVVKQSKDVVNATKGGSRKGRKPAAKK